MTRSFLFFIGFLFCFNIYAQQNIQDIICKEYSYKSISGLDLNIHSSDFLSINPDGSFEYKVDALMSSGTWLIENNILIFKYNNIDTVRFYFLNMFELQS